MKFHCGQSNGRWHIHKKSHRNQQVFDVVTNTAVDLKLSKGKTSWWYKNSSVYRVTLWLERYEMNRYTLFKNISEYILIAWSLEKWNYGKTVHKIDLIDHKKYYICSKPVIGYICSYFCYDSRQSINRTGNIRGSSQKKATLSSLYISYSNNNTLFFKEIL